MLLHMYVFLSTVFVGLQGAALYRSKIKNLSQEEIVYVANNENKPSALIDVAPMWSDAAPVEKKINEETVLQTPEEINATIMKDMEDMVALRDQKWDRKTQAVLADTEENAEEIDDEPVDVIESEPEKIEEKVALAPNPTKDEADDIQIYDYSQKTKPTALVAVANAVKNESKHDDIEKYIKKIKDISKIKEKIPPQSNKNFESTVKFIVKGISRLFNKVEIRSLLGNDNIYIEENGEGVLSKTLSSEEAIETYEANYPQMMPVFVNAIWKKDSDDQVEIPLIEQARISEMYEYFNLKGEFGLALVKLKKEIDYYEVENSKDMVFLDNDLEETTEELASYVLYLGLEPGNNELRIKVQDQYVTQNIHLIQNSITFIDMQMTDGNQVNFSLYEELPLSKTPKDLVLSAENLHPVTNNAFIEKEGLNSYSYKSLGTLRGHKEILAINNSQDCFVDVKKIDKNLTLPSNEYINQVLDTTKENRATCIIDIGVNKKIEFLETKILAEAKEYFKGKNYIFSNEEALTERFLDTDGVFYPSHSDKTQRVFLISEFTGLALIKIVFKDGSEDVQQFFCGQKSYYVDSTGE